MTDLRGENDTGLEHVRASNLVWLYGSEEGALSEHPGRHRPPRPDDDGGAPDGADAAVIDLGRRRTAPEPSPPPRSVALDGTTGLPIGVTEDPHVPLAVVGEGSRRTRAHADLILIVHPEEDTREQLGAGLRRLGFDTLFAGTTLQAMSILAQQPQLIRATLVSSLLQQTAGIDLLHFIARRYPGVKRILVMCQEECPANDVDPRIDHVVPERAWEVCALFAERR